MTSTADGGEHARRLRPTRRDAEPRITAAATTHEPDWAPLERAVAPEHRAAFMWMGWAMRPDGPPIARYKHGVTRRYLNLSEDGTAYRYVAAPDPAWCGSYVRTPLERAVDDACDGIEPTRDARSATAVADH